MALKYYPEAWLHCPHCDKLVLLMQHRKLCKTMLDKQAARKKKKEDSNG